ncbi:hypothetical protein, partial [Methanothrix sp.]|uniref:hypothetical protein n=1 Tax=Methanothrix sp. TaxID=90426 RepID=UPI003983B473
AGGTYLEDIVSRLKPSLKKGSIEYSNERSRIIHQLKTLESLGLVERGREGRHSCVKLTMLGRIMRVAT